MCCRLPMASEQYLSFICIFRFLEGALITWIEKSLCTFSENGCPKSTLTCP